MQKCRNWNRNRRQFSISMLLLRLLLPVTNINNTTNTARSKLHQTTTIVLSVSPHYVLICMCTAHYLLHTSICKLYDICNKSCSYHRCVHCMQFICGVDDGALLELYCIIAFENLTHSMPKCRYIKSLWLWAEDIYRHEQYHNTMMVYSPVPSCPVPPVLAVAYTIPYSL